jgi:hypothetical protein
MQNQRKTPIEWIAFCEPVARHDALNQIRLTNIKTHNHLKVKKYLDDYVGGLVQFGESVDKEKAYLGTY